MTINPNQAATLAASWAPRSDRFATRVRARIAMLGAAILAVGGTFASMPASADAAEIAWAKVNPNGSVVASSGFKQSEQFGIGRYFLTASANVSDCAVTGTVNNASYEDPGPGSASIAIGVTGHYLFVRTATPNVPGSRSVDDNRAFSIVIVCK